MAHSKVNIRNGKIEVVAPSSSLSLEEAQQLAGDIQENVQQALRKEKIARLIDYVQAFMQPIQVEKFVLGVEDEDPWNGPAHFVDLTQKFALSKSVVSQQFFSLVMDYNPSRYLSTDFPVDSVSWYDAILFCNMLSEYLHLEPCYSFTKDGVVWNRERNGYRLPTEAEWTYAARAGQEYQYSAGDRLEEVSSWKDDLSHPPIIGRGKANAFGLFDMTGTCFVWCFDLFGPFNTRTQIDPIGAEAGELRVCKGGAWDRDAWFSRIDFRCGMKPNLRYSNVGMRLARNL